MDIRNLIFPKKCLECGQKGKYLCNRCLKKVRLGGWRNQEIFSLWRYEGVVRKAIIALKYKFAKEISGELARVAIGKLKRKNFTKITLVPIPLFWYRQNFRGFNQAEEVGRLISQSLNWEFLPNLLLRRKATTPQVQLKGMARRQNLEGAFVLKKGVFLKNKEIAVFDDVATTGSTIREAIRVLRKTRAKKVWGLTLAK